MTDHPISTETAGSRQADESAPAGLRDYLALARANHWVKHIFIVPGVILAALLHQRNLGGAWPQILVGFLSAGFIASANYVLNEWLDAKSDAHHPTKRDRPAVAKRLSPWMVGAEYLLLVGLGMASALWISPLFALTSVAFLLGAWVYNVPPVRAKDVAYLDVATESINNPIRLTLGWAMVDSLTLPPGSLLLGYWMAGGFLMSVKRLAELRSITRLVGVEAAPLYRRSFSRYSESSLLVASLVYAMLCGFFLAVFFVKYRIEYLLALPVIALLFGTYLSLGLEEHSSAQAPENLFRESRLLLMVVVLVLLLLALSWFDMPVLQKLTDPHYIDLSFLTGG